MQFPKSLNKGDMVYLVSPAKAINANFIQQAKEIFEAWGLKVEIGKHALEKHGGFSARDKDRLADFQNAIEAKANLIVCNRGGYGCSRILESIKIPQKKDAPWILGFSDVCFLHALFQSKGIASIHSSMPLNFKTNTPESIKSIKQILFDGEIEYTLPKIQNNPIHFKGKLTGGNFSVISALWGSPYAPNLKESVLLLEDLSEELYHLDRMLQSLKWQKNFHQLNGVILGHFSGIKDSLPWFKNSDATAHIASFFNAHNIPVLQHFPAGHENDNYALVLGADIKIKTQKDGKIGVYQKLIN